MGVSDRGVKFIEDDIKSFTKEHENAKNVKMTKETRFGLKLFKRFIQSTQNRDIQDIPAAGLWFVVSIRFYSFCLYNKKNLTHWLK